jgi:phage-related minor tail protein
MIKNVKKFVKDAWVWIWGKTEVDEKAIKAYKVVMERYKLTADELSDVAKAIKQVGNQLDDIPAAIAGKKRKGRKNGTKNK